MKLEKLFPVQKQVIPALLNSNLSQSIYPNDICVTAPTGSGKTLTYVLPIIQNLKSRIRPCCRAIVLLPVSDLAEQVYSVFKLQLADDQANQAVMSENFFGTNSTSLGQLDFKNDLRVLLLSAKHPFAKEQAQLVSANGQCEMDIVVSTPGRLVDHILKTKGFCLNELRYLVLDECDRIMDQIKQNWLPILNQAVFGGDGNQRQLLTTECLNVNNLINEKCKFVPYQKILLSATLTKDPEKFEQMKLFQPIFFNIGTDDARGGSRENRLDPPLDDAKKADRDVAAPAASKKEVKTSPEQTRAKKLDNKSPGEVSANFTVPSELTEIFVQVLSLEKPLMVIYLVKKLGHRRMLCFVKSKDTARRLTKLLELNDLKAMEYSANLQPAKRKQIQAKFESDQVDVLVCSDVMARGMDLANVDYVLLYDSPKHVNSYIHKVGRTARAGRLGTAITFLEHKEIFYFKKMMHGIKQSGQLKRPDDTDTAAATVAATERKVKEIKIQKSKLKPLMDEYKSSLAKLKDALSSKKP